MKFFSKLLLMVLFIMPMVGCLSEVNKGVNPIAEESVQTTTRSTLTAPTYVKSYTRGTDYIGIYWDTVSGATGYKVYRCTSPSGYFIMIKDTTATSYHDINLQSGTTYYYKVKAYNSSSTSGYSPAGSYTTTGTHPINAPTGLSISSIGSTYATVSWNSVSEVIGYKVYVSTSSNGTYSYKGSTSNTSFTISSLKSGTTQYVKVKSYNSEITSDYSSYKSFTTLSDSSLEKPQNLKIFAHSASGIGVYWNEISNAQSYELYISTSQYGTYSLVATPSSPQYYCDNLNSGTTYYFKAKAVYSSGTSGYSLSISKTTSTGTFAPSSISMSNITYNSMKVSWSSVSGATSYKLYKSTSLNGTYSLIATTSSTYYNVTGLSYNQNYYYKVKAYKSPYYSDYSSAKSARTLIKTPTSLNWFQCGTTQIGIQWSSISGATSYKIYRASSINGVYEYIGSNTSNLYFDNITANKDYYYKVKAVCSYSTSTYSSSLKVRINQ